MYNKRRKIKSNLDAIHYLEKYYPEISFVPVCAWDISYHFYKTKEQLDDDMVGRTLYIPGKETEYTLEYTIPKS